MAVSKKVCLLGDFAVGKTSLVRRFVYDRFDDRYLSTIGVKVSRKAVAVPVGGAAVDVNLLLWDLAGSEEFTRMQASYLRGAAGAILVSDATRPETLTDLREYAANLRRISPTATIVAVANKVDLVDDTEGLRSAMETATSGFCTVSYLTSALTGERVEDLFRDLAGLVLGMGSHG